MTNELKHAFEKKQKPRRRNALKNGWTDARRKRQRAIIRTIKPWTRSTGPTSSRGKTRAAQNARKHGFRGATWTDFLRALARQRLDVRLYLAHRALVRCGEGSAFTLPEEPAKEKRHHPHKITAHAFFGAVSTDYPAYFPQTYIPVTFNGLAFLSTACAGSANGAAPDNISGCIWGALNAAIILLHIFGLPPSGIVSS